MFTLLLLYGIILFVLFVGAFFIVYHILRYSFTRSLGSFGAVLFGGVFLLLLGVNMAIFQSLEPAGAIPGLEIGPLLENGPAPLAPTRNPW